MKQYRFLMALVVILVFSFTNESRAGIEINYTTTGAKVVIKKLATIANVKNGYDDIDIVDLNKYIFKDSLLPEISFNAAVPYSWDGNYTATCFAKRKMGKFNISVPKQYKSNVTMTPRGQRRNLSIVNFTINPFDYNLLNSELSIIDSMIIEIKYTKVTKSNTKYNDYQFFADIINKNDIDFLRFTTDNKKSNTTLGDDTWFDYNTDYVRFSTRRDGIAKVSAQEVININNSFSGQPVNKLNLLYNGTNIPIYIDDANGILDAGDNIYFIGKHAAGDTTYYENYDDYAHFFLYSSDNAAPLRFVTAPDANPSGEITSVAKTVHFERDSAYFEGHEHVYTETKTFEGWYWKMIERVQYNGEEKTKNFMFDQLFFPADGTELDLKIKYTTLFYFNKVTPDYDPHFKYHFTTDLNKQTISDINLDNITNDYIKAKIAYNQLPFGVSRFNIINLKPDTTLGLLGIDYLEYSYNALPVAFNSSTDFGIVSQPSDKLLNISGFNTSKVYAFDTLNMLKYEVKTIQSDRVAVSANDNAFSAMINDSVYYSDGTGYFVFMKQTDNTCLSRKFSNAQSNEFIDFIKNSNYKAIAIGYNGKQLVPSSVSSYLSSLGSAKLSTLPTTSNWVMCLSGNISYESVGENGFAKVYSEFPSNSASSYKASIVIKPNSNSYLFIADENGCERPLVAVVGKTNLRDKSNLAEGIYISHKKFLDKAVEYANYRIAQGFKIKTIDVDDIYNQFGNGKSSPRSIKAFLEYAYKNWQSPAPAYLLIFGDACWDPKKLLPGTIATNYVPSSGRPVSDYWYGTINGYDGESELIVGRIPANEVSDVQNYFDKVKSFENIPRRRFMKNFLFLSGGQTDGERSDFYYARSYMIDLINQFDMCADTVTVAKTTSEIGSTVEMQYIRAAINNGAIWTAFLGHASSQVFDMDGWNVQNLNNKDRYGVLTTVSCNTGAFAEPFNISGRNEEYILEKDKGFIASMGSTSVGFVPQGQLLLGRMMIGIADSSINLRRVGDLLYYGKQAYPFIIDQDIEEWLTRDDFGLLGDPMIKIRIADTTSLFIEDASFSITNQAGETQISVDDEIIKINGTVLNNGYAAYDSLMIFLVHTYNGKSDTLQAKYYGICNSLDFNFDLLSQGQPGNHNISIYSKFIQSGKQELLKQQSYTVYTTSIGTIDPLPYWNINSQSPTFRFINPNSNTDKYEYEFELFENASDTLRPIHKSAKDESHEYNSHIDWQPQITLLNSKYYTLLYSAKNLTTGYQSSTESVPFNTYSPENSGNKVVAKYGAISDLRLMKNNSVQFDEAHSALTLTKPMNYNTISIVGDGVNTYRWVKMNLDTLLFFDNDVPPGIRVAHINYKLDSLIIGKKLFSTWNDSSASPDLINYLRDSVSNDDYMFFAVSGSAVRWSAEYYPRMYPNGHIGYLDTLKAELKKFGAVFSDSLRNNVSYALVGKRGAAPGSVPEKIVMSPDSAAISGSLDFFFTNGQFTTPVYGNALSWNFIDVEMENSPDSSGIDIELYGISKSTGLSELINTYNDMSHIDLTTVSAQAYPKLYFKVNMFQKNVDAKLRIKSISVDFAPAPELSITDNDLTIANDSMLCGDTNSYKFTLKNISLRTNVPLENKSSIEILKSGGETEVFEQSTAPLEKNSSREYSGDIVTENLNLTNTVAVKADNKNELNELYLFNNSVSKAFNVYDDKEKPTYSIRFDGVSVKTGDYITENPIIDVDIFDNSYLPVKDDTKYGMRINGEYITKLNTPVYEFTSYGYARPLKASVRIIPDTLKYNENSFQFYIADYNNNRDTIKLRLKLASFGKVKHCIVAPNPSIEDAKIVFDYESRTKIAEAEIRIVSAIGSEVKTLKQEIEIGKNTIIWDGRDEDSKLVAPGVYYFRLDIRNGKSVEPTYGKIVRIR